MTSSTDTRPVSGGDIPIARQPPASAWPSGIAAFFGGPFGAFVPYIQAKHARERGYPTKPYWKTYLVTWLVASVAGIAATLLFVVAVLGSFAAAGHVDGSSAVSTSSPSSVKPTQAATGPILPLAPDPVGVVKAVEQYRLNAFATGDSGQLELYYPSHTEFWQSDFNKIVNKGERNTTAKLIKVELVSFDDSTIVANVYYTDQGTPFGDRNTYRVVNGRWYYNSAIALP